jgi:hypothetical protein
LERGKTQVMIMDFSEFKSFFEKYKNYITIIVSLGAFLLGISFLILVGNAQFTKWNYEKEATIIDRNYSKQYEEVFKPEGAKKINAILYKIDNINNSQDKLNAIAEWEVQDFASFYWGNKYPEPDNLFRYYNYGNGKIRAYTNNLGMSSPFRDDLYWMAYQKAGECEEKAALFKNIADRAGFTTRGVGYPNQHAWVEIKNISNGEWFYFDPDCYHYYLGDVLNSSRWYNQTKYYRTNCLDFESQVIVDKTGEDITKAYEVPQKQQNSLQKNYIVLPFLTVKFSK